MKIQQKTCQNSKYKSKFTKRK